MSGRVCPVLSIQADFVELIQARALKEERVVALESTGVRNFRQALASPQPRRSLHRFSAAVFMSAILITTAVMSSLGGASPRNA